VDFSTLIKKLQVNLDIYHISY